MLKETTSSIVFVRIEQNKRRRRKKLARIQIAPNVANNIGVGSDASLLLHYVKRVPSISALHCRVYSKIYIYYNNCIN